MVQILVVFGTLSEFTWSFVANLQILHGDLRGILCLGAYLYVNLHGILCLGAYLYVILRAILCLGAYLYVNSQKQPKSKGPPTSTPPDKLNFFVKIRENRSQRLSPEKMGQQNTM